MLTFLTAQEKKAIINDDVIKMVKAGLPESTIILAIRQGPVRFDTTPLALIALKEQGVTQAVLDTMLKTSTGPSVSSPAASITEPPLASGVYVMTPSGWIQLEETAAQMKRRALMAFTWTYSGAKARVQVSTGQPEFFIRYSHDATIGKSGNNAKLLWETLSETDRRVFIIPLLVVNDSREEPLMNGKTYKEVVISVEAKQYSPGLASIRPTKPLPANGEYAIYALGGSLAFEQAKRLDFRVGDTGSAQELSIVHLYRKKTEILKPSLFVNGIEVLRFPGGRRCTLQLPAGPTSFKVDTRSSIPALNVTLQAGKEYHLLVKNTMRGSVVTEIDEATVAQQVLAGLPQIEEEFVRALDKLKR
jgi:hypothetical protein